MKPSPVPSTESLWRERVDAWRASGETAAQFAKTHSLSPATLRWWSSRLGPSDAPRFVRLVPRAAASPATPELLVEVGGARIRVAAGFDPTLLADVVRVLGAEAR